MNCSTPGILELAPDWTAFAGHSSNRRWRPLPNRIPSARWTCILREAHHAQVFRLLVQDINGG
jgi:hypothetical protein